MNEEDFWRTILNELRLLREEVFALRKDFAEQHYEVQDDGRYNPSTRK